MTRVFILLPVHNRRAVTERFVQCLGAQRHKDLHLVLIDDGSTDGTADMVRDRVAQVTVIRGQGRWWWAGSLQQALRWLRTSDARDDDLVLIINNDTEFDASFLERAVGLMQGRRNTLLLARLLAAPSDACLDAGIHADWKNLSFRPAAAADQVNCFSTRGLFVHVGDVHKIGGFRPVLLPHYLSDYEFTMRAYRKGFALITDPGLWLTEDATRTGERTLRTESLGRFLGVAFSKRYAANPVYWSSFVILASPWRHVPRSLWWIWRGFLRNLGTAARNSALQLFSEKS